VTWVSPDLAILVGLLTAGTVHGVRTAFRPAITASTLGIANAGVSLIEDTYAVGLAIASVVSPWVALLLFLALAAMLGLVMSWVVRQGVRISRWLSGRARQVGATTP
jgi:hypothetical protein